MVSPTIFLLFALILLFKHLAENPILPRRDFCVAVIMACHEKSYYLLCARAQTTLVDIGVKQNMFLTSDFSAHSFATSTNDEPGATPSHQQIVIQP